MPGLAPFWVTNDRIHDPLWLWLRAAAVTRRERPIEIRFYDAYFMVPGRIPDGLPPPRPRRSSRRAREIPLILLAFIPLVGHIAPMPPCTHNVKKRKARRIKNDRLQAAKKAAAAKAKV